MTIDWDNIPTINAKRVAVRPFNANDADAVYQIYANPEVMRYWGGSPMADLHEANDFLAGAQEDLRRRQCIQWGIAHRPYNQIIGTIVFLGGRFRAQGRNRVRFTASFLGYGLYARSAASCVGLRLR